MEELLLEQVGMIPEEVSVPTSVAVLVVGHQALVWLSLHGDATLCHI